MSIIAYSPLVFGQSSGLSSFCSLRRSTFGPFRAVSSSKLLFNTQRGILREPLSNTVTCAMKSYKLSDLTQREVESLKARPRIDFTSIFSVVQPIVDDVRVRGDDAVKEFVYTSCFDKVQLENIIENVNELPDPEVFV
ncbi:putative histidinol dehydrogenase [Helianthus anomalus]